MGTTLFYHISTFPLNIRFTKIFCDYSSKQIKIECIQLSKFYRKRCSVCVCVCQREREREREMLSTLEKIRNILQKLFSFLSLKFCFLGCFYLWNTGLVTGFPHAGASDSTRLSQTSVFSRP